MHAAIQFTLSEDAARDFRRRPSLRLTYGPRQYRGSGDLACVVPASPNPQARHRTPSMWHSFRQSCGSADNSPVFCLNCWRDKYFCIRKYNGALPDAGDFSTGRKTTSRAPMAGAAGHQVPRDGLEPEVWSAGRRRHPQVSDRPQAVPASPGE